MNFNKWILKETFSGTPCTYIYYKSLCHFLISLKNLLLVQSCNKTRCHTSVWFDWFTDFLLHTRRKSVFCLVIFSLQMPQFFMSSFFFIFGHGEVHDTYLEGLNSCRYSTKSSLKITTFPFESSKSYHHTV